MQNYFLKIAPDAFAYGPSRYPLSTNQCTGRLLGTPTTPPERNPPSCVFAKIVPLTSAFARFAFLRSAPVKSIPAKFIPVRSHPDRFAPGARRLQSTLEAPAVCAPRKKGMLNTRRRKRSCDVRDTMVSSHK